MSIGFKTPTGYPLEFTPYLIRGGYDGLGSSTFCWYSAVLFQRVAVVLFNHLKIDFPFWMHGPSYSAMYSLIISSLNIAWPDIVSLEGFFK